jgi:glycosyltransferase involved in cell wall biosynthesis
MKDELITFIIPTIGRPTLINSINSLKNQTIKDWRAIIIFDGISCNIDIDIDVDDNRIKILECEKKGININSAGEVRNYGMSFVETKWIAFLDDDDIIEYDYIETFYNEINLCNDLHLDLDLIIFRMNDNGRIIPKLETDNFYLCDVGISFIFKKKIYDEGYKFTPDGAEDFLYLDKIRGSGKRMMISPYVKYYVRTSDFLDDESNNIGNRVFININNNLITMLGYILFFNFFS